MITKITLAGLIGLGALGCEITVEKANVVEEGRACPAEYPIVRKEEVSFIPLVEQKPYVSGWKLCIYKGKR